MSRFFVFNLISDCVSDRLDKKVDGQFCEILNICSTDFTCCVLEVKQLWYIFVISWKGVLGWSEHRRIVVFLGLRIFFTLLRILTESWSHGHLDIGILFEILSLVWVIPWVSPKGHHKVQLIWSDIGIVMEVRVKWLHWAVTQFSDIILVWTFVQDNSFGSAFKWP